MAIDILIAAQLSEDENQIPQSIVLLQHGRSYDVMPTFDILAR